MRIVHGVFWWIVTLTTLIIVDDLLFGPVFWIISVWNALAVTALAFTASFAMQIWLVRAGTNPNPGRVAKCMLDRLLLGHKNEEVVAREASLKARASSVIGAVIVTPIIGGVIPALLLAKRGVDVGRLTYLLATIYSIEFAAIHGGYGLGGLVRLVVS